MPDYKSLGEVRIIQLISGDYPIVSKSINIPPNQNLVKGAVLGRINGTADYVLSDSSATDGSEKPIGVLAEAVETGEVGAKSVAYLSGQFNPKALSFGPGHTAESSIDGLRKLNIYLV